MLRKKYLNLRKRVSYRRMEKIALTCKKLNNLRFWKNNYDDQTVKDVVGRACGTHEKDKIHTTFYS
jgi:hypothetical protein